MSVGVYPEPLCESWAKKSVVCARAIALQAPMIGGGGLFIQVSDVEVSSEETALRGTGAREQFIITGWAAITGKRLHKSTPCQHH